MDGLIDAIVDELSLVASDGEARAEWICHDTKSSEAHANQCVFFLKPEASQIDRGVDVRAVLRIVADALTSHDVTVGLVRLLNGPYLERFSIMDSHYGVINNISRFGIAALSDETKQTLRMQCGDETTVLGGHQLLERFDRVSPFALNVLSDTVGTRKLAGGTYYIPIVIEGQAIAVLNPFHPLQLLHFTEPRKVIVVFECLTNTPWKVLRNDMIGTTNPLGASRKSIRRQLFEHKSELGLGEVSQGSNGVHLSAGPLEGMNEYARFFGGHARNETIPPTKTSFGQLLLSSGLTLSSVNYLASNPILKDGDRFVSAFDATEEMDAKIAATFLSRALELS